MTSDSFCELVSAHSQLKLHSIVPVELPPRFVRARNQSNASNRNENNPSRHHHSGQGLSPEGRQRSRNDTFAVSSSVFSSPPKHAAQVVAIPVHRSIKKGSGSRRVHREARRLDHADPIIFDPFSDSPYYGWLIQDPASSVGSQEFRQDRSNLPGFREWVSSKFPKVVKTLKALQLLHDRPPPAHVPGPPEDEDRRHETSDSDTDDLDALDPRSDAHLPPRKRLLLQQRDAQQKAWGILFESVRLLSIPPGDVFVTQDVTPAREVYVVLSGQCQTLFQPKFLDAVVQVRNTLKPNSLHRKESSFTSSHPAPHGPHPFDPLDLDSCMEALLAMRRLSLSTLTMSEATEAMGNAVYPLQRLGCGDYFGLEACVFRFPHHSLSAVSQGALQRNAIGVATTACLHVLVIPFHAIERIRFLIFSTRQLSTTTLPPPNAEMTKGQTEDSLFAPRRRMKRSVQDTKAPTAVPTPLPGCGFREEDVEFLRHTFILQSIQFKRLQYLATQIRRIHVPQHEYLFTTGQEVLVYLVQSGQLRVFSPEQVRIHTNDEDLDTSGLYQGRTECSVPLTTVETRHVELEILQTHDLVGLMEASLLQPTFSNYCLATSHDVWVYAIPPVAFFTVLAHEPTASHHAVDNLLHHHSWYKARKSTALNHHNKQTEFRLSLGAQRKSPIPCSRCGWSGHTSTSSMCVRAASPKSAFIEHLMGKDEAKPATPPPKTPSLKSRMERISQVRMAQANRTGSMAAAPTGEVGSVISGQRTTSLVMGRVGGMIPSSASLLPGLADLAMLLRTSQSNDEDPVTQVSSKSDVEKALGRLDAALDEDNHMPLITTVNATPRPKTKQTPRSVETNSMHRGSIFNLREEAIKAVARIGTAATVTPSPRAMMRRKATSLDN